MCSEAGGGCSSLAGTGYVLGTVQLNMPLMLSWHQPSMSYHWLTSMDAVIHHRGSVLAQMLTLLSGSGISHDVTNPYSN